MATSKRAGKALEFSGGLTQLQWCAGTVQQLQEEVHKSGKCFPGEHPCVANLVDGLSSSSRETVQAVCLVLTEATSRGLVSGDDVITTLISSCASMPHWTLGVHALAKLLMKKVVRAGGSLTTSPYSLRSSPLPFISIYNSKPDSGLVISDVAVQMLKESTDCFSGVVLLLTPLFKYMFLHPLPSSEHAMVSSYLHSSLLSLAESMSVGKQRNRSKLILRALKNLLPLSPSSSHQSVLILSSNVQRLAELWLKVGEEENEVMAMSDACLDLCCKCLEMSLSFEPLLRTLSKLISSPLKVQLCGDQIMCLSWLMLNSLLLPATLDLILHLVLESLKRCPQMSSYLPLMTLPLVQVLSLPPLHHHHYPPQQSSLQQSAYTLTLAIQENNNWTWDLDRVKSSRCLLGFQPYPMVKSLYNSLRSISSTTTSMKTWLNGISDQTQLSQMPSSSMQLLALTLSMLLAKNVLKSERCGSGAELSLVLKALSAVTKSQPSISPSLLPLILYLLRLTPSPSLKGTLLQSLPSLAAHKYAATPTANVLRTLAGHPSLLPVSLRLLGKLWSRHDSVFPLLASLLALQKAPATVATELDIAKAVVIKEICCTRGEQHGEEMLSHISLIFKQSRVPLATALVTDALAALCRCDIADPVTVWSVFGECLLGTESVPTVVASCSILSLASSVDSEERQAAKSFKNAALKRLWKMVFSQDHRVCSAALNGLCHFCTSDFLIEHLPPEAPTIQNATAADVFAGDFETPNTVQLPASYCVDLVTIVPTQSLPSLSQFLSSLLPSEVEAVPRGTISSVLRQSWVQSPLERAVKGVENLLLGMCVVNSGRDSPHGMVASTALMLCAMASSTEQAESQNRRGHIALKEMKKYTALLEDALTNGHVSLDCDGGEGSGGVVPAISCLVLPRRWALFMKKVCDCFTMVWLTRNCPASIWDNSSALEEKLLKARDWANRELTSKFTEVLRKTPTSSSNVLFALMGVVCSSLLSPTGSSETQTGKHAAARSCTEFLLLTITHIQCVIKGSEVEHSVNSPVSILLSDLKECVDVSEVVLVCPLLIETALAWTSLSSSPTTTFRALEDFVLCLWSHFNASPTWCCGIVMNEILLAMLPRMSQGEAIDAQLVDFAEASQQSQSFEYQTVVSSLVPTLIFMKHADHSLGVLHHLKALLEILGPEQLEMEQPQIVSINYVNSCRLLYLNGVVSDPDAMECVTHIADLATKAPHVAVYHFCLGSLIYGLMASGHPTVDDLADSIAVRWIQQLSDQTSTNELLVTMWGLAGLIGVNPTYDTMWYKDELSLLTFVDTLFPLLRDFLGKLANEENPVVGVHATWILGCTYHRLTALFSSMERVPKDYSYLPEGTLLPTLLSYVTDSRADIRQVKCLLSALLSVSDPLPPCDMGSVLFPFVKSSELQMTCVQLVINQSSHVGTKILAGHIMNLMLAGSLMTEAELQVLENLSSFVPLLPAAWKYLQPLTTLLLKLYPTSQKHLQSFLMSVNDSVTSGTTTTTTTKSLGYSEKEMIQQVWERICGCGCTVEIFSTDGKLLLRLVAECLAATGYVPISFDASVPVVRTAFECLLQACWVDSGTRGVSNLCKIMHWTLQHYGLLENGIQRALMETLVEVIRHVSSVGASQKSLVIQTELLHSLLAWTRTKQPSVSQMQLVLFLCTVVASPTPPGLTTHPSLDLVQWLASFSLPDTPVLQEKTLQCLVEWFAYSHEDVHEICLSLLSRFTSTGAYRSPVLWTTAAHLL